MLRVQGSRVISGERAAEHCGVLRNTHVHRMLPGTMCMCGKALTFAV